MPKYNIHEHKVHPLIHHFQSCKVAAYRGQFVAPIIDPLSPLVTQGFLNNLCSTGHFTFLELAPERSLLASVLTNNSTKGISINNLDSLELSESIHIAFYNGPAIYKDVYDFVQRIEPFLANESFLLFNNWKYEGNTIKLAATDSFKILTGKVHFTDEISIIQGDQLYCKGIGAFLYEKKKVNYRANSTYELTELVRTNTPCVFLKYGDGESEAAVSFLDKTYRNGNCDGTPYTEKLGKMIIDSLKVFKDKPNVYLGGHIEEIWEDIIGFPLQWCVYNSIIVKDIENMETLSFYKALKENPRKKLYIGNAQMGKACRVLGAYKHIQIDAINWFEESFEETLEAVKKEVENDSQTMILTSAGMGAKPLVGELYKLFPKAIFLDLGSALDLLCTGKITRDHHTNYQDIKNYFQELLPGDWEETLILYPNIGREGRLGNAMFQYAAVKAMALEKGVAARLPWDIDEREHHGQKCLLKYFKHSAVGFTREDLEKNGIYHHHFPNEEDILNRQEYLSLTLPIDFVGHPESELFFKKYRCEIKKEFEFIDELDSFAAEYMNNLRTPGTQVVGIHLRRGDRDITDRYLPWFRSYIEVIMENFFKGDTYTFIVFTGGSTSSGNDNKDDIEWCKRNIVTSAPLHFCEVNDTIKDLAIMTKCDHMILTARSTISWWGAYLNKNSNKKIIVPKYVPGMPFSPEIYWSDEFIQVS